MEWNVKRIRQQFLQFFEEKGHQIVPSAPLLVKNDPTLMFVNAGMNQFKDYFLGNEIPQIKRIANSQKCLRVSGKHNDLEEVGVDTYHHTLFEMLGNWSFGDYFKEEAIAWAWELLTEVYKIDTSRLYITVFEGDEKDCLAPDNESRTLWEKYISADRILAFNKKDNFWEMGESGPCGPCSEIHVDIRNDNERKKQDAKDLVNTGHPQVIEIWNLVFIQFNRKADGSLHALPNKHVDTGMGLERLAIVLQGKQSNYDSDFFQSIIVEIEKITNRKYGATDSKPDIAFRVISDHLRAVAFAIADGQLPSNNGAGYVIRRILRRAARYAYSFLEMRSGILYRLVDELVRQMGEEYKELISQKGLISKVIQEEEETFLRTLERGIQRIQLLMQESENKNISGKSAFELYDTYGFPLDLTALILREEGYTLEEKVFFEELEKQRSRSRAAGAQSTGDWVDITPTQSIDFVGYDLLKENIRIVKYREVQNKGKKEFQLVFNKTPFYPEGGGQVGDKGFIKNVNESIEIFDTKKENNLIIHIAKSLPESVETEFIAEVNESKRKLTAKNHTATHLLHFALREVLGKHVEQKGSLVDAAYLRFDFSHFAKLSDDELAKIESKVNELIFAAIPLEELRETEINKAKEMGAMALFGEKYGDKVRVIKFGSSVELCGGTHVQNTAEIGFFKITSESSVAAGIRRIEAISSIGAFAYLTNREQELEHIKNILKQPKDVIASLQNLQEENSNLLRQVVEFNKEKAKKIKQTMIAEKEQINGIDFFSNVNSLDAGITKDLIFELRTSFANALIVVVNDYTDRVMVSIALGDELKSKGKLKASELIKSISQLIKGGGGGQDFYATAGGKDNAKIDEVINLIKSFG